MRKTVNKFDNHADADRANRRYYLGLTPEERLDILLELIARYQEDHPDGTKGFQRVCRILPLHRRQPATPG